MDAEFADALVSPVRARALTGGISESTQRRLEAAGDYPTGIRITEGRKAYRVGELLEWNRARITRTRG
jgi:hypothetical protein